MRYNTLSKGIYLLNILMVLKIIHDILIGKIKYLTKTSNA